MEFSRKLSSVIAPIVTLAKWKQHALRAVAVEPLASEEAERALCYGDNVSLYSVEHSGYISTDGYVLILPKFVFVDGFI